MRVYPIAALLGMAALGIAVSARAEESPSKTDKAKAEVSKDKKALKDKLDENRAELKEKGTKLHDEMNDKREALNKEADEKRADLKEAEAKLRETRTERRTADRTALRDKYGALLNQPTVIDELKTHASRLARLNRIQRLADDQKQKKVTDRADKLIDRENKRHDARMAELKAHGSTASVNGMPATRGDIK